MSTFKEICDTVGSIEGELTSYILGGKKHKSLSKSAQDSILDFPVIVTNTLSLEDAGLVSKALEKEFASFVLTVATMNPYLYTHGTPTAQKYLHKLHQNVDVRGDITDIQNAASSLLRESFDKLGVDYEPLAEDVDKVVYHIYEGVNHTGINKEHLKFSYSIQEIANPTILNNILNTPVYENGNPPPTINRYQNYNDYSNHDQRNYGSTNNNGDITNNYDGDVRVDMDGGALGRSLGRELSRGRNGGSGGPNGFKDVKFIMDNDYKKANELVPTLIHIRIFPVDATNADAHLDPIELVIGIKATLHPVGTDELMINIVRGIKNENRVFNFIRWTTGEIRFFKDFLFTMNDLKLDAMNTSAKTSKWWTMLKRRKSLARVKNAILPDRLLPNATIVITQEEVDILQEQYGYNLNNENMVFKLMDAYFLIAFVVVDPALQRVKFLFDGRNEYETLTYATLARESTTNDKQFKEMLNMLGRRI